MGSSGKGNSSGGTYKDFNLTPKDTHNYSESEARRVRDWFKEYSNYDDLIGQMSPVEEYAFQRWAMGRFMNGQQYDGFSNMTYEDQQRTRTYDKYLDQSVIDQGVTVVRSTTAEILFGRGYDDYARIDGKRIDFRDKNGDALRALNSLKGNIILNKANLSSAGARYGLSISDPSKMFEIKFNIPAGTQGAGMWIGDRRINDWGVKQSEFLVNRDTAWSVGKSYWDESAKKYVVEMNWKGLLDHDYS